MLSLDRAAKSLSKHFRLLFQIQKRLLIMPGDNLPLRDPLQLLQPLRAPEPGRMVPSQPSLRDAVNPLSSLACPAVSYKNTVKGGR
jgi:hypothetical protein